ncbi:methyltransferase domain-containing protein [Rhizobium oryzihabitans]|uniref:Methyltransferase domain-containing protein n=1 Tax=Rhizobium oryzihabitans TaxID=2267833 RepID=A0A7L5BKI3_9HYPH|nr:methyltransferase domain-containing protein [Rhizobium oryzihabitans]QCM06482.1 methyltransferase domain-containing protein [Agrobacterium tumefaciens]QIB39400.1 methyltransferase domain-containing protein [Rhizobium oryzihabitans]CUX16611.1 Methyltransferase type 11 [Agrobacterium genomosp. 5 str. CFBP 6626]
MDGGNFDLKEEIRDYWSKRSETFDLAFGHRIAAGPEADAWQKPIRDLLGTEPKRILELACGTGEVTRLIHDLGHDVTALDFSEAMLFVARAKHAGKTRLRFIMADAENTMEPDQSYDAIICRHLVWTLTKPETAFREWFRLLRPGGRLLFVDGDWARPKPAGRFASQLIWLIDRLAGADRNYDGAQSDHHAAIMKALPFGQGLRPAMLTPLLTDAGFTNIELHSHDPIAKAQRKNANLRNRLRTYVYQRFILTCHRP